MHVIISFFREIEDSIDTDASEDNTETKGFAKEDTLENVAEMENK